MIEKLQIQNHAKRIQWIDTARGMAILLVVLGHSISWSKISLNKFILSFHMPLFFFLSGLCAVSSLSFGKFFAKKVKTLLPPQIVLGVINMIWNTAYSLYAGEAVGFAWGGYSRFLQDGFCLSCLM